ELQIQADAMLISYANKIGDILWRRGKRAVINKFGDIHNIDELISNNYNIVYNAGQEKFLLDFSDEYAIIEKELEGVVDGHFESLNGLIRHNDTSADEKGITNSDRGLKALIEHLDLKLTGGRLKEEQKDTLFKGYKETFYYAQIKNATDPEQKIYEHIIVKVIQHIIISETYMVQ
ncbi:MAG: hypothetical protein KAG56_08795, partial [Sulfurovaceae bacterium]|nr:hypothetical protein [Sulfurovaceae bacterium]